MKYILTAIIGFSTGVYFGVQLSNIVRFINAEAAWRPKADTGLFDTGPASFDSDTF
jgi:hypothetical protein